MSDPENSSNSTDYALPLVIAVTGHRDLVEGEIPAIRECVRELFRFFSRDYPDRRLQLLSPLAAGADRIAAEEALQMGIELVVPLPMPRAQYLDDFGTAESRRHFEELLDQAADSFELPLARSASVEDIAAPGEARNLQYAQLGVFLCAHCHVLLALWDGKYSGELGGTGQVVRFHHDDIMPGYTTPTLATQQMLVDDESDLVYHIVCSRDRDGGAPEQGLEPQQTCWFTKDKDEPRTPILPEQHRTIFMRSAEFSADAIRHAEAIESSSYPLLSDSDRSVLPRGIERIDRLFRMADWLAIHYQKRVVFSLRATHVFGFLMGMMFILYTDVETYQTYMIAFLVFFCLAAVVQYLAKRGSWHRRYLDYRALAEGLRVQYYWAAAGVTSGNESKYAHDNFLQTQDPELGWIRNVMRVAGMQCDAVPATNPAGVEYAIREWVGDQSCGQLGYFRIKAMDRIRRNRITERLGRTSLIFSVGVIATIVAVGGGLDGDLRDTMVAGMGAMLLLVAIRQGYAYSTAEKELIKQYEFMLRIFLNARRRLDSADDDTERRQIFRALGGSALDEHAEWILMHRDRALDQGEIWRMGS